MNEKSHYRTIFGGFDRTGATAKERTAYDLGVMDNNLKLTEWRPYAQLSDKRLIDLYEKHTNVNFLHVSVELFAFGILWYFMRPFFWALLVLVGLYFIFILFFQSIRLDKLKRELRIRNKGRW